MKRKIKKGPIIFIIILIIILIAAFYIVKTINYHKTYDYKLKQAGYSNEEIISIKKLNNSNIDYILTIKYNKDINKIINEKYFIEKNFKQYLKIINDSKKSLTETIAIVNVHAYNDWYTDTKDADTSKNNLMLVNKFYKLDKNYNSDKMVKVSNQYSYGDNQMLTEETFNAYLNMYNAAKSEKLNLIINSSFRSYEEQDEIYNDYKNLKGEEYADSIAARAGFSEHQTGMAIDIQTYGSKGSTFETFKEFEWLKNNAYKYGFILRYPKDKECLTGYAYESWHYRYVGKEIASYIQKNNITFDEYYAYFIEKD